MFRTLKLSFGVGMLAFFGLATVLAIFQTNWVIFCPILLSPWAQPFYAKALIKPYLH